MNSPSLAAAVDRHAKAISFSPYVVQFAKRLLLPSKAALATLAADLQEENGEYGCRPETLKAMHLALAPGNSLSRTTQDFLDSMTGVLESLPTGAEFDLFSWVRKIMTRASTDAIFGARQNPFQDPAVETGFWSIDKDFALLGLNLFPKLIAPVGDRGRKTLFGGFRKYYAQDGHRNASRLVQARYEVNRKYNVSTEDIVRFDLSVCYGLLTNTVPATFWTLYYIYSQPSLLREVRAAISQYCQTVPNAFGGITRRINIADLAAGYPLLSAIIHETLRVQSTNASGRVVLKDTTLEDRYYLKKNSILLIPSREMHCNAEIWGPTHRDFDPQRFMHKGRKDGVKAPASAYRAFGSGDSVCPGRYLAANEIIIVIVMMVVNHELNPVQEEWLMPQSRGHISTSILTPEGDFSVIKTKRKDVEHDDIKFVWEESPER